MARRDGHKLRLLLSALLTIIVLLGACLLALDPSYRSLTFVVTGTLAGLLLATAIIRRIRRLEHAASIATHDSTGLPAARHESAIEPAEPPVAPPQSPGAEPEPVARQPLASAIHAARNRLVASLQRLEKGETTTEVVRCHAQQLDLLVGELTARKFADSGIKRNGLRLVVDDAIAVHALMHPPGIAVLFARDACATIEGNPGLLRALIFHYLLEANPPADALLHVSLAAGNRLMCYFDGVDVDTPRARFEALREQSGARLHQGVLEVPVAVIRGTNIGLRGSAELIAPTTSLDAVMTERLQALGITVAPASREPELLVIVDEGAGMPGGADFDANLPRLLVGATSPAPPGIDRAIGWPIHEAELLAAIHSILESPMPETTTVEDALLAHSKRQVLTVDDNPAFHELLSLQLNERGIAFESATSADGARQALAATAFDAVLIDIHLAGESGIELAAELRRHHPSLAVCLFTAGSSAEEETFARTHNLPIFTKPLDIDALIHFMETGLTPDVEPAPPSAPLKRFDAELALRLTGERPELAEELMATLLESLNAEIDALRSALDAASSDDRSVLREAAHRFSGSLQYCGAPRLRQASRTLERTAATASLQAVRVALLNLEAEAHALESEYRSIQKPFHTSVVAKTPRAATPPE